jgi:DNA-binding MurR/RpiR family transcriptional regulator
VLAFSHTGRNRRTVEGATLARQAGATIIGITGQLDSPLTEISDICLLLPEQDASTARICGTALVGALAGCVAEQGEKSKLASTRCDKNIETMLIQRVPKAA